MTPNDGVWTGGWVTKRLGVTIRTASALRGLEMSDLVGMAVRRNPRRAHLLVSQVLGKHVPVDPRIVRGSGLLLGELARRVLLGVGDDVNGLGPGQVLHDVLSGQAEPRALMESVERFAAAVEGHPRALVMGYAETATGLGQCVADALRAPSISSTRRRVPGFEPVGAFEEEHSHATSHLVLPSDSAFFAATDAGRALPLVLVDDELSTGRTVLNTIAALQHVYPRERYVIATLIDLRTDADRDAMTNRAAELGVSIDVVALAHGEIDLPADVLERGQALVDAVEADARVAQHRASATHGEVTEVAVPWPVRTPLTARHGVMPEQIAVLETGGLRPNHSIDAAARTLLDAGNLGDDVLVLGTEELMYAPLRLAASLADHGARVSYSTTTRSPVLAEDAPDYAIRSALIFPAFDERADGSGPRFAYNVSRETPWSTIVLCVDPPAVTPALWDEGGVVEALAGCADRVIVAKLPEPTTQPATPLRGPGFGSYPAEDVIWLLKDLSHAQLEAPTEEREEAIQAGGAHYAESLPVEYQPDAAYQELFHEALERSKQRVAEAVAAVTELALAARGHGLVLVSLARAGTPVGLLMRRWAQHAHRLDVPHYAVSIVRGRGIDSVALDHIAARHDPASVLFVDGWTGKGAISKELAAALDEYAAATGIRFPGELAVLADTGSCTTLWGTRDDYLIPSACLNSTVSGLVSRTVLNDELIGPGEFHGAKFYSDLAGADVSNLFVDEVTVAFPDAHRAATIRAEATERCACEPPTWSGWATVEHLSEEFGIHDVNLVKPGVGETTRVLLRRVPWKVLIHPDAYDDVQHILALAQSRGVPVEEYPGLAYSCVGIIHPKYTRGATGADGTTTAGAAK